MQQRVLIILGMHRSGTSLVTNWLYHCGLQVGENLLGKNAGNEEGHFEDTEFLKLHEEILAANNLPDTGLFADKNIEISAYQKAKIRAVIDVKNELFEQWGWKEPRTCLFLDTYKSLIPQAHYLVIVRDYRPVVNSLLKRDFRTIEEQYLSRNFLQRLIWRSFKRDVRRKEFYRLKAEYYLKVWIDYNERIINFLKEIAPEQYLVVSYAALEKNDKKPFLFLAERWRFNLRYIPFLDVYKENLISSLPDLSMFFTDKNLLARANDTEAQLKRLAEADQ
ncbi:MAG: sulfotransferase [Bacteroidetes bacterium]|nr:sulfotransferase [Bacteroidota bacterium]